MSLNFNLSNIKNYETVCYNEDGTLRGLTTGLIYMMPVIGMSGITTATAKTVYLRLATYETLFGPVRGYERVTLKQVLAHVGLTANVEPESDAKWERRILKAFKRMHDFRLEEEIPVLDRRRLDHRGADNV